MKKTNIYRLVLVASIAVTMSGCMNFCSNPEDIEVFLKPDQVEIAAERYVLRPPDQLIVLCSTIPELHLQQQSIRPDGMVAFENFGEIEATGLTPKQLSHKIREKAQGLYSLSGDHPIDVRVVEYNSAHYYVIGQVVFPGAKRFTGRDTVLSALARARVTVLGWGDKIQIIRPTYTDGERARIFEIKYEDMVVRGDLRKNVLLAEGDIVYIPPTILAAIAMKVEEFVRPIGRAFSTVNIVNGPE